MNRDLPARLLLCALLVIMTGCSTLVAPQYQPSVSNASALTDSGKAKISLGEFTSGTTKPEQVNELSLRLSSLRSPYENSFVAYLKEALKSELESLGRFASQAPLKLSGELLENKMDVSGFSTGQGSAKARFVLSEGDTKLYDKVHGVTHEWPSSFVGPLALRYGLDNYGTMIQKLIGKLFGDDEFRKALAKY